MRHLRLLAFLWHTDVMWLATWKSTVQNIAR